MKTLKYLLQKEFRQIVRNKVIFRLILVMPVIQLLIIPLAADYEIKNINIAIIDHDRSVFSQDLTKSITSSGYFRLADYGNSYPHAFQLIEKDKADLILEIPLNFEKDLYRENRGQLLVSVNAINGAKAAVGGAYLSRIIASFNRDIRLSLSTPNGVSAIPMIEIATSNWFNYYLNYQSFMVPGILAILVSMIGIYMTALNIVKEKEAGTIEQINVTPIKKQYFILGKMIPFWVIGMFMFSVGLLIIARFVYGIVPEGSFLVLYGYLSVYLIAVLGLGLLISTYSNTQQQAMSLAFFIIMIAILMGGLFTSIESMPAWAQWIARINPVSYFIEVMRMIIMKGSGLNDIKVHLLVTAGFAVFFNTWAVFNYKKTS